MQSPNCWWQKSTLVFVLFLMWGGGKRWRDLPIPLLYFSLVLEPTESRPPSCDTPPEDRWCFNWTGQIPPRVAWWFFFFFLKPPAPFPFGAVHVNSCVLSQGRETVTEQTRKHQPGPISSGSPQLKRFETNSGFTNELEKRETNGT